MTGRHLPLCLIGAGGHALVVRDAAIASGHTILGYYDDSASPPLADLAERLGTIDDLLAARTHPPCPAILCVGDLDARRRILDHLPDTIDWATIRHPSAIVSPEATIEHAVFVAPGAVINARAAIAPHAIINSGAIIEHDCRIAANVHIAPRATLAGGVTVEQDTLMGIASAANPGVRIGPRCIVGAGAVVVRDIPADSTALGIPARALARR